MISQFPPSVAGARALCEFDALKVEINGEKILYCLPGWEIVLKPSSRRSPRNPTPDIPAGASAKFFGINNTHELILLYNGSIQRGIHLDQVMNSRAPSSNPAPEEVQIRLTLIESLVAPKDVGKVDQADGRHRHKGGAKYGNKETGRENKKKKKACTPKKTKKRKREGSTEEEDDEESSAPSPKKKRVNSNAKSSRNPSSKTNELSPILNEKINFNGTPMAGFMFLATPEFANREISFSMKPSSKTE